MHPNLDIYICVPFLFEFSYEVWGLGRKEKKRKEKNVSALSLFPPLILVLFPAPPLTTHLAII